NHLVIQVESMQATVRRLTEVGTEVEASGSPDGSEEFWTAWLTDPDGYRIELVQWPAGHPDGMTAADFAGQSGSSRFLVNESAEKGVHAAVRAALASRIRAR